MKKRTKTKVALLEIGGSHDECILTQVIALKEAGCEVVFCGTQELYDRNILFSDWFDAFHPIVLTGAAIGDFKEIRAFNKWLLKNDFSHLIANTAQGGHIRNLALTGSSKIAYLGIIHTIKMLEESFTQKLISTRFKTYFVLNDTLQQKAKKQNGIRLASFYPLDYPHFESVPLSKGDAFWVGIIGGVEFRRKDLSGFIEMAKNSGNNVKFIFLGKSDNKNKEVQQFQTWIKEEGLENKVQLFDHFVDQPTFDAYLKQMDCIIPLVHPNTPSAQEYFNRQISGAINVAFSYHIPMLIHQQFQNWSDFDSGCVFYNLENIDEQLKQLQTKKEELKEELIHNPKFSKEAQRRSYAAIVLGF